ncbi:MAG: DUF4440 domain-containing protein [Acidobacteriaceae bacterium]|nr:DUF4440 domain-containing protein [Acidobacteriaceae bacterium]MBV9501236.1 DUF4440 domain-containing protein [Acidobacteriaceae bacterium]
MQTALLLALIPFALVATSCITSSSGDRRAADASAIQALDEQWSATAARNDLNGTIAFYADDAVLLAPNTPIATDRNSIRESWAALLRDAAVSWKVSKIEVAKSGELGYLYGTYRFQSGAQRVDRRSVIPANSSRSGESRRTESGSASSIPTTPTCQPFQYPKRRSNSKDCPKGGLVPKLDLSDEQVIPYSRDASIMLSLTQFCCKTGGGFVRRLSLVSVCAFRRLHHNL